MGHDLQNKTILIIEDSQVCLALIRAFFRDTGATLLLADTAEAAWQLFTANDFDLVLTDLRLPDADGLALVKRMKQARPEIPVIIQTACTVDFSENECMTSGCDDYISKPYPRKLFMEKVLKHLSKSEISH
jgi:two-component system, NtrC family, response regulator HydG